MILEGLEGVWVGGHVVEVEFLVLKSLDPFVW